MITFVAAMLIANNAAASFYACLTGLGTVVGIAATHMGHMEHTGNAGALCLKQCIRSYRDSAQEFAANGSDIVFLPVPTSPSPALRTKPARARIAWAPRAPAPKLFLLFGNLRN